MKQWLSGSLIYSLLFKLYAQLKAPLRKTKEIAVWQFEGSILKKFYNCTVNFLGKEAQIERSVFFKVMTRFGSLLKRVAAGLNSFFKLQFDNSLLWKIIKDTDKEFCKNPYVLAGLVFAGAFVSYAAAVLLKGAVGTISLAIMAVLFLTAAILILIKDNIKNVICGSLTYKLIAMVVKAVLP